MNGCDFHLDLSIREPIKGPERKVWACTTSMRMQALQAASLGVRGEAVVA